MNDIYNIVLRSSAVYFCIIIMIRLFGKKELSQVSVIDLVFILLISNSVQNAMVGNSTSLQGGLIAAMTLFLLNLLLRRVIFRFRPLEKLLEGGPVLLIYHGRVVEKNLRRERITMEELLAAVREHGIEKPEDVNLAVLEADGNISMLSEGFTKQTVRRIRHHRALNERQ